MSNLDKIAEEFFNKIRSRFSKVKIGDENGAVTNDPSNARFFDFDFGSGGKLMGRVNVKIENGKLIMIYNDLLLKDASEDAKKDWFDFLKEVRLFARSNLMTFDTRDITKSNLDVRDYKYLANNKVNESCGSRKKHIKTERIGEATIVMNHRKTADDKFAIESIFIESPSGERFKYSSKHLGGARAMARHVSCGGTAYDDIGKHISGLSEELANLRKFKRHTQKNVNEAMTSISEKITERIVDIQREVANIQRQKGYEKFAESFTPYSLDEVPKYIEEEWVNALTIRQFNEELRAVFPYVYKLVAEKSTLQYDDIVDICPKCGNKDCKCKKLDKQENSVKLRSVSKESPSQKDISSPRKEILPREVVEYIEGFYDRETRSFPRGEEGVKLAVEKKFGKTAGKFASHVVERLIVNNDIERIKKLAGNS